MGEASSFRIVPLCECGLGAYFEPFRLILEGLPLLQWTHLKLVKDWFTEPNELVPVEGCSPYFFHTKVRPSVALLPM